MNNSDKTKPKVFISYAWGSKDYQDKVLSFANDLMSVGIDVELDKWSLIEGNDTYAYMEKCVTDESITNVIILLDKNYEQKANNRSGGVGTETQIISPEIYNKVKQEKFIPVVFERGQNGEIYKPVFLKSLLHFDLTLEEQYDEEYQRLVRRLKGIITLKKPPLGNEPAWLYMQSEISTKQRVAYESLKLNQPENIKINQFRAYLNEIQSKIIDFKSEKDFSVSENVLSIYHEMKYIRDEFIKLIEYFPYVNESSLLITEILESTVNHVNYTNNEFKDLKLTLIHEVFIYFIAIYYKNQNYSGISYILGKTYFLHDDANSYMIFYHYNDQLNNLINKRDGKKYHSGTAQFWIDNINIDACSKNEFVFADIFIYNYAVFGASYVSRSQWFPLCYVYAEQPNYFFKSFAVRLKSREHLEKCANLFGYEIIKDFVDKFKKNEEDYGNRLLKNARYGDAYRDAPLIIEYIKSSELGIYN